jgi:hypothetical protein
MVKGLFKQWFKSLSNRGRIELLTWAERETHEPMKLDRINSKMVRPVDGADGSPMVIDGKQYYEFVNAADMPQARFIHYLDINRELSSGVAREDAKNFLEQMKLANNDGDASKLGALIFMLEDLIMNSTPMEVLYKLAALVYFDPEEDLSCFDGDYNARKVKLFKALPNQTFFLTRLLSKGLKTLGAESPKDIEKSLNEAAVKIRAYREMLEEMKAQATTES